jgi:hypothetical protein
VPAIDFITAFGRLLRDGAMRDALAANPHDLLAQLNLRERDRAALAQIIPADLEFQARVLLRKRFDMVRRIVPETCRLLGAETWPVFHAYARTHWLAPGQSAAHDAHGFCLHLQHHQPDSLCEAELNRLRFTFSQDRFAFHFIGRKLTRNQTKPAFQIILRFNRQRWREIVIYFRL